LARYRQESLLRLARSDENPYPSICGAFLLLRKFYCGDRPVASVTSDGNSETVEFIKPEPVHCSSLPISQNHGLANKLGLSLFEFDKNRAGSRLAVGIVDDWLAD
jgi:hypothetical protein